MLRQCWLVVGLLVAVGTASFDKNLNYGSASRRHAFLGIDIPKVTKRTLANQPYAPENLDFTHGVASGDPTANSVILWTRAAPTTENDKSNVTVEGYAPLYDHDNEKYVKASNSPICLEWRISEDEGLKQVVDQGTVYTSSDVDFTVKVEAKNLTAFTTHYYKFNICGSEVASPVGRTKTIPESGKKVDKPIKLAIYSCNNYPFGFFNAYGNVVRKDSVDYVVHVGDYIYEYKNGDYGWGDSLGRVPLPNREILTLYDYRKRIATYRTDLDLVASHQNFAWFPTWDDHEIADNGWKDGFAHMNNTEESFIEHDGISVDQRKMNAVRAYFEWMPIRQVDLDDNLRIWRNFKFGDLFDLIILDTRNYNRGITNLYDNTDYVHAISNDPGRSLMGVNQENWFFRQLEESKSTWKLVANQIVFSRLNLSAALGDENPLNYDAWDGYIASKNRTLNTLYSNKVDNTIFLAGDSHAAWVSDLVWLDEKPYDPETGQGSIGVEFAGSAVSSPCPIGQNTTKSVALAGSTLTTTANDELQWQDLFYRGYFELTLTYESAEAAFFGVPKLDTRNGLEVSLANFTVNVGENKLQRPVAGGRVEWGSLKGGETVPINLTHDTKTGEWK